MTRWIDPVANAKMNNSKIYKHRAAVSVSEEEFFYQRDATLEQKAAVCELTGYKMSQWPVLTLTKQKANRILREYGFTSWSQVGAL